MTTKAARAGAHSSEAGGAARVEPPTRTAGRHLHAIRPRAVSLPNAPRDDLGWMVATSVDALVSDYGQFQREHIGTPMRDAFGDGADRPWKRSDDA